MKKLITLSGSDALLELTNRCYTGCKYCYKKLTVNTKGEHVSLETLKKRVDWLKEFTDATDVYLLGGEALLSPYFIEICEYVKAQGFELHLITSGVVSKLWYEQANYLYMLDQYRKGLMKIEVSYHIGRNEKAYTELLRQIQSSFRVRRRHLKNAGKLMPMNTDVHTTIVAPSGITYDALMSEVKKVAKIFNWKFETVLEKTKPQFDQHFISKDLALSARFSSLDDHRGFRVSLTIMGEREIQSQNGKVNIYMPPGAVCPSVNVEVEEDQIKANSLLIRADGGLIFPVSQCVDMSGPLLNVDLHKTRKQVYQNFAGSIAQMKSNVYRFNRLKAKDNCGPDGKELACTACPFDKMCTPCWHTKRPWQK